MTATPQEIKHTRARRGLFFPSLQNYNRAWLRPDIIAGLSTAAIVVPVSMAYATLGQLPPQVGLYTALIALPLYSLFGTSMILSVSVTSTLSLLAGDAVSRIVSVGDMGAFMAATATLALMTGIVLLLAGLLRLGFIASFISQPVLSGMKIGLGLWILTGQFGKILGIPFTSGNVFSNIDQVLRQINLISLPTLALAIITIAVLVVLARTAPKVPSALVAVVLGIGAQVLLNLEAQGVALIGDIPHGLPPIALPDLSYVEGLWPAAFGIALMSAIESIATARTFARPDDPRVLPNREWISLGVVNLGTSLVRGLPTGGGTTQSIVNIRSGGRTQLSQIVTAVVVVLALTLLAGVFSLMPAATLGAIVFFTASGLIKPKEILQIAEVRRRDAILATVAFVATLFLGTLEAVVVAALLSMLALLYEANTPPVDVLGRKRGTDVYRSHDEKPDDETFEGLLILRPEGRLYFANVDHVYEQIRNLVETASPPVSVLLLDGSATPDIEYTALEMLRQLNRELEREGVEVWVAAQNPRPMEMLRKRREQAGIENDRIFLSVEDAVNRYLARKGNTPAAEQPAPPTSE